MWVPASVLRREDGVHLSLCYGGVLLNPDITRGQVPSLPPHTIAVEVQSLPTYSIQQTLSRLFNSLHKQDWIYVPHSKSISAPTSTWNIAFASRKPLMDEQDFSQTALKCYIPQTAQVTMTYHSNKALSVIAGVSVLSYGVTNLVRVFKDKSAKAVDSLKEFSSSPFENPNCKEKSCVSCSINGNCFSKSFMSNSGQLYSIISKIQVESKNVIYFLQSKLPDAKKYIGLSTREGIACMKEYLHNSALASSLLENINELGCFGQFSEHMEIVPLACVSEATMSAFTRTTLQKKKVMEYIVGRFMTLLPSENLINDATPNSELSGFDRKLQRKAPEVLFFVSSDGSVIVDRKVVLAPAILTEGDPQ